MIGPAIGADALTGGFTHPSTDAARAFRVVLDALSRPGTIATTSGAAAPPPLSAAAAIVILTLVDATTPLHLAGAHDIKPLRDWVIFHTGAPIVAAPDAQFAVGTWDALLPQDRFRIGTADYPDRSATLIVELPDLLPAGARLTGPGIRTTAFLNLPAIQAFQANRQHFPCGLDFLLTCGDRLAGVPRTTIVEAV
jgi:alpha-D-ribose 1-methylphosphonate 5-triphosphate synthase subunit PhnH